ncbi:MAG TPA: NAD(P)-dependent oxidoreductase [Vicinamibacterales bacterium]|nr:NAD(P)-dependent oxidoreductase [Vicinamibacterales bacterium]
MTYWAGRRVLVTGARGFIASHLCRRLIDDEAVVCGISTKAIKGREGMTWRQIDLTNRVAVRELIAEVRPEVIFHLAGHVTGSQSVEQVAPTLDQNLISTINILTASVETVRSPVLLAGSMQEPDPKDPAGVLPSPYAASKWACNAYARMFHGLYQLPVSIARPFMVYGPGQWDSVKLLPYVITSFLNGESPRVSSGDRVMDWVYVDDVVDGFLLVASSEYMDGRTIDLGTGDLVSIREIVDRVRRLLGTSVEATFGAVPDRPFERPHAARVDETKQLIGWTASTSLDDGLRHAIGWYRDQFVSGAVSR